MVALCIISKSKDFDPILLVLNVVFLYIFHTLHMLLVMGTNLFQPRKIIRSTLERYNLLFLATFYSGMVYDCGVVHVNLSKSLV